MKVVYRDTIVDKIRKANEDAYASKRRIHYILLDADEWHEAMYISAVSTDFVTYKVHGVEIRKAP